MVRTHPSTPEQRAQLATAMLAHHRKALGWTVREAV
jgi:hypothetical protein